MVRSLPLHSETRPQPARILAIAAAIAVHAFAFLLLLIPMATPAPDTRIVDPEPAIPWWKIEPKPVTPTPPEIVPVREQKTKPQTQPRIVPDTTTTISEEIVVDQGTIAVEPAADTSNSIIPFDGDIGRPLAGVQLEYASAKAPPYPREAFRQGLQGQVLLKILVDTDGKPLEVVVETSSGHRVLDDAARRFVLNNWRFKPAMRDGQAVQAYGMVPIDFTLQ